jgi:hypothetical protein
MTKNFYKEKGVQKYLSNVDNPNLKLHGLDKLPFRLVCCAPSGSGKTNMILNLVEKFSKGKVTFNSNTIITRNKSEPLYEFLEDKSNKKVKIEEGLESLPAMDTFDKDLQHLVIFDDMVLEKNQKAMSEMYIRGRKRGISVCYLSQSFYKIPKTIRSNCNYFVLLKLSGKRDLNLILSEFELGVTKDELMEMYDDATKEKFSFLLVDVEADKEKKFRKNFLEIYEI